MKIKMQPATKKINVQLSWGCYSRDETYRVIFIFGEFWTLGGLLTTMGKEGKYFAESSKLGLIICVLV